MSESVHMSESDYLSHSTTYNFFPFQLCPIGISLTYSVRIFWGNVSSQSETGLCNQQLIACLPAWPHAVTLQVFFPLCFI